MTGKVDGLALIVLDQGESTPRFGGAVSATQQWAAILCGKNQMGDGERDTEPLNSL